MMQPQIRNFLLLIFSAFFLTTIGLFSVGYYFGPSGSYIAKNILIQPDLLQRLSFKDRSGDFVFDRIDYQVQIPKDGKIISLSPSVYNEFFKIIANDESYLEASETIISQFMVGSQTRIIIRLKSSSHSQSEQIFQEIQFAPEGDLYRIQLHEDNPKIQWAYFRHAYILDIINRLSQKTS